MSEIVINAEGLSKKFEIGHQRQGDLRNSLINKLYFLLGKNETTKEDFWAIKDVSFQIKKGEAVAIIGRNGAGKSTLLKILSRITDPTKGRFEINGRVSSLLEVGTGFHPELTGRENIYLNGTILGMKRKEIKNKFDEIVSFSGVEKFIDTPVKHYSSGMKVRLAFSVAAHLEPEILIVDEVLAVGDAEFQKKCMGKMDEVSKNQGRTVLFVSHNMAAVKNLCKTGILLREGKIADQGSINQVIGGYLGETKRNSTILKNIPFTGTGKVKFSSLDIKVDNQNPPIADDIIQIQMGASVNFTCTLVTSEKLTTNLFVAISIFDQHGVKIATLDNLYLNKPFEISSEKLKVYCSVDDMNLNTGVYYLDLWCSDGYETFQKIEQVLYFEITDINNLNTGKAQTASKHGYFYFKQNWNVI